MYGINPPPPMLIDCSHCRKPLTLPQGAQSIRCAICHRVTQVATYTRHAAAAPSHPDSPTNNNNHVNRHYTQAAPPNAHGSKKALIIGITYMRSRYKLKGCLNDARCMKYLLVNKFRFPESCVLLLTEDQTDRHRLPTKHNIKMAMYWLVQGCKSGDSLVFHYSGHGSQQRNRDGGEVDGFDETILPMDFETQGMIVDDEINMSIVRPLTHGVRLHAIVDACHSGTVLDLPFLCRMQSPDGYVWEDHRPPNGMWKGTSGGDAYCFSGCADDQTSVDTSAMSQVNAQSQINTGAMTFCFIQAIERGQARTYKELLSAMRNGVQSSSSRYGGPVTSLIEMLLSGGSLRNRVQEPQLTASYAFDINTAFSL